MLLKLVHVPESLEGSLNILRIPNYCYNLCLVNMI